MSVWALVWVAILIAVYISTYLLNKNTPKPEGCEEIVDCSGCNDITCSNHSAHKKEEVNND